MSLISYFKSKSFIFSIVTALIILVLLIFGTLKFLNVYTRHGEEIEIPNLAKMSAEEAEIHLDDIGLEIVVIDTVDFTTKVPPLTIAWQEPTAGAFVKEGRKVYVKINAKNYASIRLPKLENRSLRHALATLEMVGLQQGELIYEPDFAKDVILRIEQDGRILREGDKVLKNSKINLVLGDGSLGYTPQKQDTISEIIEAVAPTIDSIF